MYGGAALEIEREGMCVGLYVIVSYVFEVHWFWLFLLLSGAFCTFGQGIHSRSPSDSFYVSRAG
jgi:hypothetical protein